ncbi:MAG: prepilin peptidase [Cyanobacteriota bacterium]|nr:prepilin peptidase [Cyanobacteriota bacterium]
MWELYLPIWIAILYVGAAVGSFINVVVYRLPLGLSLIQPGSHCPHCKTPLGPSENVPILGWLWLRGHCRHCGVAISWRYPAVEALTMGLYGLSFLVLGLSPQAGIVCVLLSWLLALALIDLDTFLLLEELTQSGLLLGIPVRLLMPWLEGSGSGMASLESLLAGILGAVLGIWSLEIIGYLGKLFLGREAMGLGDGKLLAMVGMWLGWPGVVVTLLVGCLVGTLGGAIGMAMQRVQWGRPIPFGPYLAIGGAVAALVGQPLIGLYLRISGLAEPI